MATIITTQTNSKNDMYNFSFKISCMFNHVNGAQASYELSKNSHYEKPTISINEFIQACQSGHKEIAELLYNLSKIDDNIKIDIHANNGNAFKVACFYGHKNVAEWLYNLSKSDDNTKINIHVENNYAFKYACYGGHKDVVEFLYNISRVDNNIPIEINDDNDFEFKTACNNQHKNLAEWFCTINKDYSIITNKYDNIIYYNIKNKQYKLNLNLKRVFESNNDEYIMNILNDLYENIPITEINDVICPICLSDFEEYHVQLQCNHTVCIQCAVFAYEINKKCHYKCNIPVDFNTSKLVKFKLNYSN